jgi:hypothetical protein
MVSAYLLLNFVGRMVLLGAFLGALLITLPFAVLAVTSLSFLLFVPYSIVYGTLGGALVGGVSGLTMGIVTLIFYRVPSDKAMYEFIMLVTSVATAFIATMIVGYTLLGWLAIFVAIPALVAAGYMCFQITEWYLAWCEQHSDTPAAT